MTGIKKHWKKSEILLEALKYLAMNYEQEGCRYRKERHVCFTLEEVAKDNTDAWKQVKEIHAYINELLVAGDYECDCYEEWLSLVHGITYEENKTPEGFNKLQYSRKQWMLWMIE